MIPWNDEELRAELDALPDSNENRGWTPELDALLLEYDPKKHKEKLAKVLGVSAKTAYRRYVFLTGGSK